MSSVITIDQTFPLIVFSERYAFCVATFYPLRLYPCNPTRRSFLQLNPNFAIYSRDAHSFHLPCGLFPLIKSLLSPCLLEFISSSWPNQVFCPFKMPLYRYRSSLATSTIFALPFGVYFLGCQFVGRSFIVVLCLYRIVPGFRLVLFSLSTLLNMLCLCLCLLFLL